MILVLKQGTPKTDVDALCAWLTAAYGVQTADFRQQHDHRRLVGDTSNIPIETLELQKAVDRVMKVQEPYKRANRKFHPDNTQIRIGDVSVGTDRSCVIAGPCSVESEDQVTGIAGMVKAAGAVMLRGGAFKPRSSPYYSRA
jgi:3-deoxy-7-phosphoheptulonate synthase